MKIIHKEIVFEDERGWIIDILDEVIENVTIISSKKGAVRGNHYHKETIQYVFILKGKLKFLTQAPGEGIKTTVVDFGNLTFSPPLEKHTFVALEDSELLVLTQGPRGGKNYEKDTYRLAQNLA